MSKTSSRAPIRISIFKGLDQIAACLIFPDGDSNEQMLELGRRIAGVLGMADEWTAFDSARFFDPCHGKPFGGPHRCDACGVEHETFQSNCRACGAPLSPAAVDPGPRPPPFPRRFSWPVLRHALLLQRGFIVVALLAIFGFLGFFAAIHGIPGSLFNRKGEPIGLVMLALLALGLLMLRFWGRIAGRYLHTYRNDEEKGAEVLQVYDERSQLDSAPPQAESMSIAGHPWDRGLVGALARRAARRPGRSHPDDSSAKPGADAPNAEQHPRGRRSRATPGPWVVVYRFEDGRLDWTGEDRSFSVYRPAVTVGQRVWVLHRVSDLDSNLLYYPPMD